ncbi:uncharacterized protein A4U43_C07F18330 [Asparagus officinalis]|uniref:Uncharacterized protein n=1 Tax=Asparagus officinalis TaxID=4686 RepID=A0A5P1EGA9_ASPOF|nr:uncharacterized protein A4U43_C07F18330 [Asparagus officinalis]
MAVSLTLIPLFLFGSEVTVAITNSREIMASDEASQKFAAQQRSEPTSVEGAVDDPELIASTVQMSIQNSTQRRSLAYLTCGTGNPIDDCWRCDPHWHRKRKRLADCGIGFDHNALGGHNGCSSTSTSPTELVQARLLPCGEQ